MRQNLKRNQDLIPRKRSRAINTESVPERVRRYITVSMGLSRKVKTTRSLGGTKSERTGDYRNEWRVGVSFGRRDLKSFRTGYICVGP